MFDFRDLAEPNPNVNTQATNYERCLIYTHSHSQLTHSLTHCLTKIFSYKANFARTVQNVVSRRGFASGHHGDPLAPVKPFTVELFIIIFWRIVWISLLNCIVFLFCERELFLFVNVCSLDDRTNNIKIDKFFSFALVFNQFLFIILLHFHDILMNFARFVDLCCCFTNIKLYTLFVTFFVFRKVGDFCFLLRTFFIWK